MSEFSKQYDEAVKAYIAAKEQSILDSGNVSSLYCYINSKLYQTCSVPSLLKPDGSHTTSNEYFASVLRKMIV